MGLRGRTVMGGALGFGSALDFGGGDSGFLAFCGVL